MQSTTMAYAFVFSDFLRKLLGRVFGLATFGLSFVTGAGGQVLGASFDLWIVFIPPLIYYGIKRYLTKLKAEQQADFTAKWNGGLREAIMSKWCTQDEYLFQSPWTATG